MSGMAPEAREPRDKHGENRPTAPVFNRGIVDSSHILSGYQPTTKGGDGY